MGLIETPEFNNQDVCPNNFVHKHTHIQYMLLFLDQLSVIL